MDDHIPIFAEFAFADEESAVVKINIGHGQREGLVDAQSGRIKETDEQMQTLRMHGPRKSGAGDFPEQSSYVCGAVEVETDCPLHAKGVFAQDVALRIDGVEIERKPAHYS